MSTCFKLSPTGFLLVRVTAPSMTRQGVVLGSGQTANQWSGTELQGTEELRVRPRRGEQVRRDLQGGQVLAREGVVCHICVVLVTTAF